MRIFAYKSTEVVLSKFAVAIFSSERKKRKSNHLEFPLPLGELGSSKYMPSKKIYSFQHLH